MSTNNKHIAIVGAGLIGCLLSIYLKRRGYKVSIFERRPDPREYVVDGGRSINLALSNRGLRALEEIGIADQLNGLATPMKGRAMHDPLGKLSFLPYGKEGQCINSISRGGLNVMLLHQAEDLGVHVNFNHHCSHVDLDQTRLTFTHLDGQQTESAFDLVLGADGAFSVIRSAMQVTDRFDYAQSYIEHGYKELTIPADLGKKLEKNALHIWPRESFMLIALPNPDDTFTCTLFLSFEGENSFESLDTDEKVTNFFSTNFSDALPLLPNLIEEFNQNPTSSLVTIQCYPWARNNTVLIGDAAHAMLPFFGQGMNSGFEDCRILNHLLDVHKDHWPSTMEAFQQFRKPDGDAIAQLALENFVEMRDLVADADFLLRKKIEACLHERYPKKWIPLYSMVTFMDDMRYSEALTIGKKQQLIMDDVMSDPNIFDSWESLDFEAIVKRLF